MGSSFAKKLSGFDCTVLAYDKYKKGYGSELVKEVDMAELFEKSDVISLHVPLTAETNYLMDASFFKQCKKHVYIINTARGKCLNTKDLVEALQTGHVAGACLDVLEYESVSFESMSATELPEPMQYLIASEKVVLSPHIAGWTHESNYKMSRIMADKIIDCLKPKS